MPRPLCKGALGHRLHSQDGLHFQAETEHASNGIRLNAVWNEGEQCHASSTSHQLDATIMLLSHTELQDVGSCNRNISSSLLVEGCHGSSRGQKALW